ncbi:phage terminase small subunit P27 family [Staphylococcus epidermidis]|jgi:P27 family predicted phage terminase small subunit|uniref:phage terminase small subunit P27 family n=1 Tax=Staphylococcus epidermidis TaxID=1282 RepID=UPI000CD3EBED|nr:phage terminase small subunit P27 family [Staphylococcus epidermidis]DAM77375.1 MAG TPA: terminase small subunit [Caudoviricetes sp.]MCE5045795.1 phage terminase small subunit P27 family [Staphylococcus epidermidis]RIL63879.1 phage terminase small subunit P27 family [Staphylococcus epidermidis]WMM16872.1 phage terminase small subunit P27 family [Staphylococcus epidermidis]DAZ07117.1 MAG TPA: terminase small subunit [Caudoviricetes sp.]
MARPRKLNLQKQGHRTKEELQEAENVENGLYEFDQINVENLPEDLTEGAAKEWVRVVPLLQQLPIAELDYGLIKKYCQLVDISDEAYQEMQQVGTYQPDNHRKTGPYVTFMDTTREIISICGKLGMTIDSRMRLVVPVEKDKAKSVYDEFGVDEDD